MDERESTAVGDLNSDARGSGARKNEGKPQLDLIPIYVWRARWSRELHTREQEMLWRALEAWQDGDDNALLRWLSSDCPEAWLMESVKVLEFGAKKYKAWNWAKGMDWSVCVGCILRHCNAIHRGEEVDPESGCLHIGHVVCNIIFLNHYLKAYPEGDDRPPRVDDVIPVNLDK